MASLPQFQSSDQNFQMMQTRWASLINPVISRPQNSSTILPNIVLAIGDNTIPHTLNRALQGWNIVRIRAASTIYDKQDDNTAPDVSLVLNSSAVTTVDLEVF